MVILSITTSNKTQHINVESRHPKIDLKNSQIGFRLKTIPFPKNLASVYLPLSRRWIVLTDNLLLTFKERRKYSSPTEVIILKEIVAVKTVEDM